MTDISDSKTWEEIKVKLRNKFLDLVEEDFKFEKGKRNDMLDRIAAKAGKTREELVIIMAFK